MSDSVWPGTWGYEFVEISFGERVARQLQPDKTHLLAAFAGLQDDGSQRAEPRYGQASPAFPLLYARTALFPINVDAGLQKLFVAVETCVDRRLSHGDHRDSRPHLRDASEHGHTGPLRRIPRDESDENGQGRRSHVERRRRERRSRCERPQVGVSQRFGETLDPSRLEEDVKSPVSNERRQRVRVRRGIECGTRSLDFFGERGRRRPQSVQERLLRLRHPSESSVIAPSSSHLEATLRYARTDRRPSASVETLPRESGRLFDIRSLRTSKFERGCVRSWESFPT